MDDKEDSQFFSRIPLDPVNDLMGLFDIHIVRNLCMDGCHAPARSVIMYDQIMRPLDPVVALDELLDLPVYLRIDRLSDQRLQRIPCDADACPHDDESHSRSHDSVDIDPCHTQEHKGEHCRAGRDHISHGIREHSLHHL